LIVFFFSSRRRHTRSKRDWSSDVCSSDLNWSWIRIACEARRLFRPEPRPGIDPGTSILPRWRSTTELSGQRDKTLPTNDRKAKSLYPFMVNITHAVD